MIRALLLLLGTLIPASIGWAQPIQYRVVSLPFFIDFGDVKVGDTAVRKFPAYVQGAQYWQGPWESSATVSFSSAFKVLNTPLFHYSPIVPASDSIAFAFIPTDTLPASAYIVVSVGSPLDSITPMQINVRGNYREPKIVTKPRVDSIMVDENRDQLVIFGSFETEPDEVTIDDVSVKIIRWTPYWLRCDLPFMGRGSCGPVIVRNGSLKSGSRNITEINFTIEKLWMQGAKNRGVSHHDLQKTYVRIRADLESPIRAGNTHTVSFLARSQTPTRWGGSRSWSTHSSGQSMSFDASYPWMDSMESAGVAFFGSIDLNTLRINGTLKLRGNATVHSRYTEVSGAFNEIWKTTYDTSTRPLDQTNILSIPLSDSFTVIEHTESGDIIGFFVLDYEVDSVYIVMDPSTRFAPLIPNAQKWISSYPMDIDLGDVAIGDTAYGKVGAIVVNGVPWHGPYGSEVVRMSGDTAFEAMNHPNLAYTGSIPMDSIVVRFVPTRAGTATATFHIRAGSAQDSITHSGFIIRANVLPSSAVQQPALPAFYVDPVSNTVRGVQVDSRLYIIDVLGRVVHEFAQVYSNELLLPSLASGRYFIVMESELGVRTLTYSMMR